MGMVFTNSKKRRRRWRFPRSKWVDRSVLAFFLFSGALFALSHYVTHANPVFFAAMRAYATIAGGALVLAGVLLYGGFIVAYAVGVGFAKRRYSAAIALTFGLGLLTYSLGPLISNFYAYEAVYAGELDGETVRVARIHTLFMPCTLPLSASGSFQECVDYHVYTCTDYAGQMCREVARYTSEQITHITDVQRAEFGYTLFTPSGPLETITTNWPH